MLQSYLKIAWRNLLRDRQFTFLNLIGLAAGLACAILIYLWVADELNFDRFHEKNSQLFQVMANGESSNGIATITQTPALLAKALAEEMPEVEYAAASIPVSWGATTTLSVKDKNTKAIGQFAGKDYFNLFSWHLIQGNTNELLSDKNSIVLSKGLALKLFNTTDNIIGKTVEWQHDRQFIVSGIFEDIPSNSSIQFDFVLPFENFLDANPYEKDWNNSDPSTYVVLKKGAKIEAFSRKISGLIKAHDAKSGTTLFIRPFSRGYLYGNYENGVEAGGRIQYVRLFSLIAIFILVIACINFMNLSTAKSSGRIKEIGIKKVMGASRRTLVLQYMGESMLMTFLSMSVALVAVSLLLVPFNGITGKHLVLHLEPTMLLPVLGIGLFTGLVAGSYPALYLSGFNPITGLKGKLKTSIGEVFIRKGLVVFQFALSVIFIVSVLVVYKQIVFIQSKNPGYNKDNSIIITMDGNAIETLIKNTTAFLTEAKNIPGIVNASSMDHSSIVADFGTTGDINWEGKSPHDKINFGNIGFNYGMIETLGMEMAEGRSFSRQLSSDSSEIIFNQAAIDAMGMKDPVGKVVKMWGQDRKIAGIVRDFHFESLHETVKPFAIRLEPLFTNTVVAKIKAGTQAQTIDRLGQLYKKYNPGFTFDYHFIDQNYQVQYSAEKRVAVLSRWFAGLSILISCLGLFGLASFTAQRKQKEIGIRKVLGATTGVVVALLSVDFLKLILLAVVIAFPLAWLVMNQWLNGFAYRTSIGIKIFLAAGFVTILLTLVSISFQAIKAALVNPVKSLRSE